MLAEGRIRSVLASPAELTGELVPETPGAEPVAFRTSRIGIEHDERLAAMLDQYLPQDYDTDPLGGRERILRVHTKKVPVGGEIDLRHIAAMTPGFVGADLANLVNEAALLAARKGKDRVERAEFEEGVERIIAGPEKQQRVIRPDEKERIAVHKAGHALVARSLPETDPVHKVSIVGRGNGMGGYKAALDRHPTSVPNPLANVP